MYLEKGPCQGEKVSEYQCFIQYTFHCTGSERFSNNHTEDFGSHINEREDICIIRNDINPADDWNIGHFINLWS